MKLCSTKRYAAAWWPSWVQRREKTKNQMVYAAFSAFHWTLTGAPDQPTSWPAAERTAGEQTKTSSMCRNVSISQGSKIRQMVLLGAVHGSFSLQFIAFWASFSILTAVYSWTGWLYWKWLARDTVQWLRCFYSNIFLLFTFWLTTIAYGIFMINCLAIWRLGQNGAITSEGQLLLFSTQITVAI